MTHADTFAFPVATVDGYSQYGMTKRECFAAMALQGILACYPQWPLPEDTKRAAELAAAAADALIAELDPYK